MSASIAQQQIPKHPGSLGVALFAVLLLTAASARANDMSTGKGAPVYDAGGRTIYYQHGVKVINNNRQPDVHVVGRPVNIPHGPAEAWPYYATPMAGPRSPEVGFEGWTYMLTPGPVYQLWHGR